MPTVNGHVDVDTGRCSGARVQGGSRGCLGRGAVVARRGWKILDHWILWLTIAGWLPLDVRGAEWQSGLGHRWRTLEPGSGGRPHLTPMPGARTGIRFTNQLSDERALENSLRTSGSGVAAGDVDGDGWCDLYFCGLDNRNSLYRNLGNWRFEEIAETAGVGCAGQDSTGAVLADVDGDRDLDLLVNGVGRGTRLFLNDGRGRFQESTNAGLLGRFGATSVALADIDGNGTLDLYVANYATTKIEDRPNARFESKRVGDRIVLTAIDGVPMTSPDLTNRYYVDAERVVRELGEPDAVYLGDGRGGFRLVSWTDGTFADDQGKPLGAPPLDFGLSVMFRDMNGDRAPDIYVCNDLFPPDRIWVNDGRGRFRAMSNLAVRQTCRFAMGVDFADINRDGHDDFFVVDMLSREHAMRKMQTVGVLPIFLPPGLINNRPQYKRNTLFLGRADGTYAEIAQLAGLAATEWSWMPVFLDVDLDGYEDVLVTTGHTRDSLNADAVARILKERTGRRLTDLEQRALKKKHYPVLHSMNQAFRNRGDLTFEDKARDWGFVHEGTSHGMALADLDNDGDPEVIVNNLNDEAGIYRFDATGPRIGVRLKGRAPNTQGIGAKIHVLGGRWTQSQEMIAGGRYLSGDEAQRMFAVEPEAAALSIEVRWRNGGVSVVTGVQANRLYEIDEAGASTGAAPVPTANAVSPFFTDVSHLLGHVHVDAPFDDFERQPLLSRRLSQLGPGVSWFDVDGDGREDLVVGSGAGGTMAVFTNTLSGFQKSMAAVLREPVGRDQTTVLGRVRPGGRRTLMAGSANYEDGQPRGGLALEYGLDQDAPLGGLPGWEISVGPLALADVDGDGWLDLFVGGRVEAARYPETPSSLLFRGAATGSFAVDGPNCQKLALAGLVSGAVFADLDMDGDPDLVLACEWGPLRVFRNDQGRLTAWDWRVVVEGRPQWQALRQLTGFWNSVAAGDFDGDGRLDLVAGNWGRNSRYEGFRQQPPRVYYGEWTVSGVTDVLEAYHDPVLGKYVPWAAYRVARLLPWIVERFQTQTDYSTAGVDELLGERRASAKVLEAAWLESTLLLNRGDRFEARVLPNEAQFAPGFGLVVADFDGDGAEDVFVAQNFFAMDGETSRCDAGRGVLLVGDGKGGLRAVAGEESGLKIYGEQRGAAGGDYDGDGRVDLVVSQNGAETKLYRNARARPGLRVRLSGPVGNPTGAGVQLRVVGDRGPGPVREVHAGGGYWSQDGSVQVLSDVGGGEVRRLEVRWPGAAAVTVQVPAGAREITVDPAGKVIHSR